MIEVRGLKKSFGTTSERIEILRDINLFINKGETIALLGKSGSGKSTLLSLLAGLDRPDEGEIIIDGMNLFKSTEKDLTRFRSSSVGIVFQQFHLISTLTALENILLPLEINHHANAFEKAQFLIDAVGLSHRAHHLPSELSGGECQRVAIARAMSISPKIIFADEPSGNLDEDTGKQVMDLLFKLVHDSDSTLILVTHDQELAKRCKRIVHLEHGSLV
jgi:putative ABC transport system ATP-binding protein